MITAVSYMLGKFSRMNFKGRSTVLLVDLIGTSCVLTIAYFATRFYAMKQKKVLWACHASDKLPFQLGRHFKNGVFNSLTDEEWKDQGAMLGNAVAWGNDALAAEIVQKGCVANNKQYLLMKLTGMKAGVEAVEAQNEKAKKWYDDTEQCMGDADF